jgi:hypothetical protein
MMLDAFALLFMVFMGEELTSAGGRFESAIAFESYFKGVVFEMLSLNLLGFRPCQQ